MGDASVKTMVIPSQLDQVALVAEALLQDLEAVNTFSKEAIFAIRLALDEAVTNAVRHGNQLAPDKTATITYAITPQTCRITVCDQGPGFTLCDVPDPTEEQNLCRPHGRGVMLMHAYMDEVSFNDTGSCVTLVKHAQ